MNIGSLTTDPFFSFFCSFYFSLNFIWLFFFFFFSVC